MGDSRKHRGPHPSDRKLFGEDRLESLQSATRHLAWLQSRGYANPSSLKLVGDRFNLTERQRKAVMRCSCSDAALAARGERQLLSSQLVGQRIEIDGFNVLTTIEAALSGGMVLSARDQCFRDLASMHGSYRKVAETQTALELIGQTLQSLGVQQAVWYLDQPVSNAGRLSTIIRATANEHDWPVDVQLVRDPDPVLAVSEQVVATADSEILNQDIRWFSLAREVVRTLIPDAWIVALPGDASP